MSECSGVSREMKRVSYSCPMMNMPMVLALPPGGLVGMSIFDLDGGAGNEYVERLSLERYAYFKTPLRPSSGNEIATTVAVDQNGDLTTFRSTAPGTPIDNPSNPLVLTHICLNGPSIQELHGSPPDACEPLIYEA